MRGASGGIIRFELAALLFYLVIIIYVWSGVLCSRMDRYILWSAFILRNDIRWILHSKPIGGLDVSQLSVVKPENLALHENAWMGWLAMFIITPLDRAGLNYGLVCMQ